jgi:ssRNA-specific RNase YbeY (16S rRNA maturation enzyme)
VNNVGKESTVVEHLAYPKPSLKPSKAYHHAFQHYCHHISHGLLHLGLSFTHARSSILTKPLVRSDEAFSGLELLF